MVPHVPTTRRPIKWGDLLLGFTLRWIQILLIHSFLLYNDRLRHSSLCRGRHCDAILREQLHTCEVVRILQHYQLPTRRALMPQYNSPG